MLSKSLLHRYYINTTSILSALFHSYRDSLRQFLIQHQLRQDQCLINALSWSIRPEYYTHRYVWFITIECLVHYYRTVMVHYYRMPYYCVVLQQTCHFDTTSIYIAKLSECCSSILHNTNKITKLQLCKVRNSTQFYQYCQY
jgi:hypothetical protein